MTDTTADNKLSLNASIAPIGERLIRHLLALAATLCIVMGIGLAVLLSYLHNEERKQANDLGAAFAQVVEEQTARTFQALELRLDIAADTLSHARSHSAGDPNSAQTLLAMNARDLPFVRANKKYEHHLE